MIYVIHLMITLQHWGDKLVEKLPSSRRNTFENYLTTPIKNIIFCYPTDKYEISSLIRKLKDNKSPGPDKMYGVRNY